MFNYFQHVPNILKCFFCSCSQERFLRKCFYEVENPSHYGGGGGTDGSCVVGLQVRNSNNRKPYFTKKNKYFLTFFAGDQEAHAAPEPQDVHLCPEGALLPPRQAGAGAHWVRRLQLAAGRARVRRGGVQGPGSRFSFLKKQIYIYYFPREETASQLFYVFDGF